jgi:hypothetical protein
MKLDRMNVEELVQAFVVIAVEQDKAERSFDMARYRRLYWQMDALKKELHRREDDQRRALLPLLDHPNPKVRLESAIAIWALAPEAARAALQRISDRNEYPQAADAREAMDSIDRGIFVPT